MKHKHRYTSYLLLSAACIALCGLMIFYPDTALTSAAKGVTLWANTVLPALLPFFICANFMVAMRIPEYVGFLFDRPFRKIFGTSGKAAFIFIVSITSGYPMGAKLIGDLVARNEINRLEARRMLSFCSTSGPLFMLGSVGAGMLGSPAAGTVIATSHYLAALINGVLFRLLTSRKNPSKQDTIRQTVKLSRLPRLGSMVPERSLLEILNESIISAFKTLGIICAFIVLFMMITDFFGNFGLFTIVESDTGKAMLKGMFEMTVGCDAVSQLHLNLGLKSICCAMLISWGGLSIMAQSISVLKDTGIGMRYYFAVKATHGLLTGLMATILTSALLVSEGSASVFLQHLSSAGTIHDSIPILYQLFFSLKMIIIVVAVWIILAVTDRLRRKTAIARKRKEIER